MWVNFGQTVAMGLMFGIVYLDQDYNQQGVINIGGAMFLVLTAVTYVYQFTVINTFCLELPVFLREHHNGVYRVEIYYITKQLAELPVFLVLPVILASITYWMVGLNDDIDRFLIFVLIILILTQLITSWGEFILIIYSMQ